ncbi:MAG: lysophospholipase [Paucibacter sp.]|nr:lysophospholipase [Roseateles sp.]
MQNLTTEDGLSLHLRTWYHRGDTAPRGTVLVVHGLGEHIGRYEALAQRLNQAGWNVVGYDHRGHGASEGRRGDMPDAQALLRDLARVIDAIGTDARLKAGRLVLLGHSMGGLVAARFVAGGLTASAAGVLPSWFRPVDGLVLSSPALAVAMNGLQRLMLFVGGKLAPHLAANNGLNAQWISRDPEVVRAYRADPLVHDRITPTLAKFIIDAGHLVRRLAPDWIVPTLLLWGGADRCVVPAGNEEFAAAAPATLVRSHGFEPLAHEIFNEPERAQVFDEVEAWLNTVF